MIEATIVVALGGLAFAAGPVVWRRHATKQRERLSDNTGNSEVSDS